MRPDDDPVPRPDSRAGVEALLRPRSIAIVGATPRVEALGGRPIVNLRTQGYPGRIYPVNPRYGDILGLRCYPDLPALPEAPDLVLVLVGQDRVFATLDEAVQVGARAALVFGAGFAETGGDGVERQRRLRSYAARGLRICGPNCNGLFSVVDRTALGFMPTLEFPPRAGRVALLAQSGNVGTCVSSRGMELGTGFSHFVSTGNEADLEVTDFVEYLLDEPATGVFALFVEGFKDPARFLRVAADALRRGKPVVAMKMGRTESSARVALSHTGAMTGSYDVITGALRQHGVIVVEDLDALRSTAAMLACGARPRGGGLAVASLSGGMAGVIADACHEQGVPLARFAPDTERALAAHLPGVANLANPLDMTGQVVNEPDCWASCLGILSDDPGVDAVLGVLSITAGQIERRFASDTVAQAARGGVPQVCLWMSGSPTGSGIEVLAGAGMPVHLRVGDAVGAIGAWRHWGTTRDARIAALDARPRPDAPRSPAGTPRPDGWALLAEAGIQTVAQERVRDHAGLRAALARVGTPVALKLECDAIAHKTEHGALRLGVRDLADAVAAFDALMEIARREAVGAGARVLVQRMVPGRRELILGVKHEPGLGPAVLVGLGGIFSEVFRDVSVRVAPLSALDAREMLDALRARALLGGVRGLAPVAPGLLEDVLVRLSGLALRHADWLGELDVNPLIVSDDGASAVAVDVLVAARPGAG